MEGWRGRKERREEKGWKGGERVKKGEEREAKRNGGRERDRERERGRGVEGREGGREDGG